MIVAQLHEWEVNQYKNIYVDSPTRITVSYLEERNPRVFFQKETLGAKLSIGKYCSIAVDTRFYLGGNHNYNRVTTYLPPDGIEIDNNSPNFLTKGDINVGNDVWIGDGATILSGINIGDGAIIASYSVVTKDVEPYTIVGGNPAKQIRKRFDKQTIDKMIVYQWWNWKESLVIENSKKIFSENIKDFFELAEIIYQDESNYVKYDG